MKSIIRYGTAAAALAAALTMAPVAYSADNEVVKITRTRKSPCGVIAATPSVHRHQDRPAKVSQRRLNTRTLARI